MFPYGPQALLKAQLKLVDALTRVDFEVYAPEAESVFLIGEMTRWRDEKLAMHRDPDGFWRIQVRLRSGQWFYKFEIDGEWLADPGNPLRAEDGIGYGNDHSFLFVGEGDWQVRSDVPRGESFEISVPSRALGRAVPVTIYLPPGLDRRADYPLLLLLHGHAMRANQWPSNGCLPAYMDNLLGEGAIQPFIVAMPAGHDGVDMTRYGRFLAEELLAWLPRVLPVTSRPAQRAVAGMSIRGYGPLALALDHPEAFAYVAPINEIFADHVLAAAPELNDAPFRLDLYCTLEACARLRYEALVRAAKPAQGQLRYTRIPGVPTWRHWNAMTRSLLRTVDTQFAQSGANSI
ncbi:alpha/beta hydrolase-fold protein [Niveibacterium terrae]|uniref:alpha/beta hydrolase-fold protein n=1 Tax=Niveibacterium terrae TaxID=3373598 RepID=UPI003A8D81C5